MKKSVGIFLAVMASAAVFVFGIGAAEQTNDSLQDLMTGNKRYVDGKCQTAKAGAEFRVELSKGQHPGAVIVACSDSRVAPEIVFNQDLGHVFVVRTAGNVVDAVALGSIEYAVEHLHTPLIIVLGHESCGAVTAAVGSEGEPHGNIGEIIKKILPAVQKAKAAIKPNEDVILKATIENVKLVASDIVAKSEVIGHEKKEGKVKIVGAFYSLSKGTVETVQL